MIIIMTKQKNMKKKEEITTITPNYFVVRILVDVFSFASSSEHLEKTKENNKNHKNKK